MVTAKKVVARSRELEKALQKLVLMELLRNSSGLESVARKLSEKEHRQIGVGEVKGLIREHFRAAAVAERFANRCKG